MYSFAARWRKEPNYKERKELEPFTLEQLFLSWLTFGIGLAVAALGLAAEAIAGKRRDDQRVKLDKAL